MSFQSEKEDNVDSCTNQELKQDVEVIYEEVIYDNNTWEITDLPKESLK